MILLYREVFRQNTGFSKLCKWAAWVIVITYFAPFFFVPIFRCTPVSYAWNGWRGDTVGHCLNYSVFTWSHNAVNIILDLIVIILPIPQVWKLQMDLKRKLNLVAMFSIGLL